MKPFSLAAKLGLKVGLMSAALLFLFATFGYLMVDQALDRSARTDLEVKMAGMAHNLSTLADLRCQRRCPPTGRSGDGPQQSVRQHFRIAAE